MKKTLLLICLPFLAISQTTFTETTIDTGPATIGIKKVVPLDFNQDSLVDVAIIRIGQDEIFAYQNNGTGWGPQISVADSLSFPADICATDVASDGFPDVASVSLFAKNLRLHPNQNGVFGNNQILDSNYIFPNEIFSTDFNIDGWDDLLVVDDTAVYYFENNGIGGYNKNQVAGKTEYYCGGIADINGDSLPDILLGSIKLYTYINNGNGTFTRDTRNEALINDFIFEIELADIDGDGDNDMAIYYGNTNSYIDWYKNDSTGQFSFGGSITSSSNDVKSMRFADFTNDGLPDFVTAYGQTGELVWMENQGAGVFSAENVLKTYSIILREVAVADVDFDGDIDIFCGHNNDGLFLWKNNLNTISIQENKLAPVLYPNPTEGALHLNCSQPGFYSVTDVNGRKLIENKNLSTGENEIQLKLKPGIYFFTWKEGTKTFSQKIQIK